jgi:transcriptional regulator with XRE-family HTH domain
MKVKSFLRELMRRRKLLPSQLAVELGVSHATMHRWLTDEDIPSTKACRRLAEYAGIPVQEVLATAGHIAEVNAVEPIAWPEFREYARAKYADELDDDLITMIEDLIERKRQKKQVPVRRKSIHK